MAIESTSAAGVEYLTQNSCFSVDYTRIGQANGRIVIGFDLSEPVFVHAVVHA